MKYAMSYIIVVAIALLAACAGAPKKADTTARCNEAPQWITKDAAGNAVGIFVCFGEENRLLYTARVLQPTPPAPAAAPLTDDENLSLDVGKTEVARLTTPTDNGIKSAKKSASTPAPHAPPATPLPTANGTAQ
jgi:hypothetical protein